MLVLMIVVLAVVAVAAALVLWRASLGQRAGAYDLKTNPTRPPGGGF